MSDFKPFSMLEAAQGASVIQNVRNNALQAAAAQERQKMLSPLMAAAAQGDTNATKQVVGIDPELGNKILDATSKMNDEQREQFKHRVGTIGVGLQSVLDMPPVYQDQAYQVLREDLSAQFGPEAVKGLPEKFDPGLAQLRADQAKTMNELISSRGTAFQPTPAYDAEGNLVFMQGTNIPGKAPTKIEGYRPIDKVEQAVDIEKGKSQVQAKYGAEIEGAKAAGKSAIEKSDKAMENLAAVRKNMTNIDEAIAAIDAGAESGIIASKLPSITSASVELDNIRSRMGLDVISGTTFGALSEGELKFALDSAVPKNMSPKDLRAWMVKKKSAQQKLAQELEDAAIYLGKPGNTPAGYLEFKRNQQQPSPSNTPKSRFQIEVVN